MAFTKVTNAGIGSTNTVLLHNLNVVGTVTATDGIFSGIGSFGGNVSVGGVLTYEDVTNVDSVGLITARNGITVLGAGVTIAAGGLNVNAGVSTFGGNVTVGSGITLSSDGDVYTTGVSTFTGVSNFDSSIKVSDKIVRLGDADTCVRFPAADTVTVETSGSERARVDSNGKVLIGTTSDVAPDSFASKLQIDSGNAAGSIAIGRHTASASAPALLFHKSRTGSAAGATIVLNNDTLGIINFYGADGVDRNTAAAAIAAQVDGTPGSNDMPGRLVFRTTADGASTPTERMRILQTGDVNIGNEGGTAAHHASGLFNAVTPKFEVKLGAAANSYTRYINIMNPGAQTGSETLGRVGIKLSLGSESSSGESNKSGIIYAESTSGYNNGTSLCFATNGSERARIDSNGKICVRHTNALHSGNLQVATSGADAIDVNAYSSTAANGGRLTFYRSKNATIGSNTIVADNDSLGRIDFRGYNSNGNAYNIGATFEAEVDGTVDSTTDMPSALTFGTSAEGSSTPTERLRISSTGLMTQTGQTRISQSSTHSHGLNAGTVLEVRGDSIGSGVVDVDYFKGLKIALNDQTEWGGQAQFSVGRWTESGNNARSTLMVSLAHGQINSGSDADANIFMCRSDGYFLVTGDGSWGAGYQTEGVSLRSHGDSTFVRTESPAVTITRKSNAGKVLDFYNDTQYAGGIYVNGNGNTAIQQTSDYRLKTDVSSMTDGITKVKLLNPIYFKNNTGFDTTTTQNGFLAHEIQSVLPTLVDGEKDGPIDEKGKGYQTMDYAGLTPTLTAAVKELIAKVETLETEVAALKSS